jgi:hypothetical protein
MTTDEREQLAALNATVQTEFTHITKRLDSHAADIRKLTDCMRQVEKKFDIHYAVGEPSKPDPEPEAEASKARLMDREMLWRITIALVMAAVAFVGAYFGISK